MNVIQLVKELIEIPSESGNEREIGKYLENRLKQNFKVKIQKVGDRFNVLATLGNPTILLTTHMDTVPGQLEIKEDDKYLYGRGSCDAKASIASMITAAEKAKKQGLTNFGLLFDVDEEMDFKGIEKAVNLVNPSYVVVGEPTSLQVVTGQKGLLGIELSYKGKEAHGSTPEKGKSAINPMIDALYKLKAIELPSSSLGKTTINIGVINGGTGANVVPKYAGAKVEFRTTIPNRDLKRILSSAIGKYRVTADYNPVESEAWFTGISKRRIIVPYFTEMFWWAKKSKAVVLGPGDIRYAHKDNERVAKKDLGKAVNAYCSIIEQTIRKSKT